MIELKTGREITTSEAYFLETQSSNVSRKSSQFKDYIPSIESSTSQVIQKKNNAISSDNSNAESSSEYGEQEIEEEFQITASQDSESSDIESETQEPESSLDPLTMLAVPMQKQIKNIRL
jgi:hypothetical protein